MGVVYEAMDKVRNERVALKTLNRLDPQLLYSLKSEFRMVQDLYHPNLIRLGQLFEDSGSWFFTMEMIDGSQFLNYVRSSRTPVPITFDVVGDDPTVNIDDGDQAESPKPAMIVGECCDFDRLRTALEGIVSGLHALHQTGVVHCDVKPGNIMITERGRVVLLDFGLAHDLSDNNLDDTVLGTPAYMAPEQAEGETPTAASDWYAVGATLYQAMTGQLPFSGKMVDVIYRKRTSDPPLPSTRASDLPADLEALCMDLLARDPEMRPSGEEILRRVARSKPVKAIGRPATASSAPFVGRKRELAMLESAFASVKPGVPAVVHVQAGSGLGKTALVEHFLHIVEMRPDSVVLRGRCFERAAVPFKGLDHLIDSLSYYLKGLRRSEVLALLPEGLFELLEIFPVLRQVRGVKAEAAAEEKVASTDPRERRSRAFAALRDLLAAVAERKRLILFVDDLQWSDVDSTVLLSTLLRGPSAPGMLLIDSYRTEDIDDPIIQALTTASSSDVDTRRMVLEPLSEEETRELAGFLLAGQQSERRAELVDKIAQEVGGSPLLLAEIARHLEPSDSSADSALDISLDDVIKRRLARLPEGPRALLRTIAVIGRPVDPRFAISAAKLSGGEDAMQLLASAYMVNMQRGERETVEVFHQGLRKAVLQEISEEGLGVIHQQIAEAIGQGEWQDADLLQLDWAIATGSPDTLKYLLEAARRAEKALAFERAAELYRQALLLCEPEQASEMRRNLADILCLAGRGAEAAEEYLALAEEEEGLGKLDLIRRAADNLLWTGHIEDGLQHLGDVMKQLGIRLPASRNGTIALLLSKRLQLSFRRGRYQSAKPAGSGDSEDLVKIDTLYGASTSLGMIDHLRGSLLQSQCLLWALRAGDEWRICRALAAEVGYLAVQAGKGPRAAEALGRDVLLRAERLGDNFLLGGARVGIGISHFFSGRFPAARTILAEALTYLKRESGAWWELNTAQFFHCLAQLNEGDFLSYAPSVKRIINRAERRNDAYMHYLFSGHPSIWCAMRDDDVQGAHEGLQSVLKSWPKGASYQAHYSVMAGSAMSLLYQGKAEEAATLMDSPKNRKLLRHLMINRMPFIQGEVDKLRGRAALLLSDDKTARLMAGRLRSSSVGIAKAMGTLLLAPLVLRSGESEEAQQLLAEAAELYEQSGAQHVVRACNFQLGRIIGGERGDTVCEASLDWMRGQGVVSPERMIEFLSPGFD
jgi:serine/threonine protein kinase/tetratricopeptide (TPR) repeat protein